MKKIWPKGNQCWDDWYPVCKEPTKTDLNCHIKVSTALKTWHTAWNGERRWGGRRQHEDMHTNWSSGLRLFLHTGRWENSIIIYALPWGKVSRWTQRDMSLSIVENSISSTGYELVQNKNPMRLFEAVYTFQFVELRTEVFHVYGNWLLNAWTEWGAQSIAVATCKHQPNMGPKNSAEMKNSYSLYHSHCPSRSPKRLSTL